MAIDTEKLAQNPTFTVITRMLMILASVFGVPIAMLMINRVLSAADDISAKVGAQGTKIELLDQSVKFGFEATKGDIAGMKIQITDHEGRIRIIERGPR